MFEHSRDLPQLGKLAFSTSALPFGASEQQADKSIKLQITSNEEADGETLPYLATTSSRRGCAEKMDVPGYASVYTCASFCLCLGMQLGLAP